MVAYPTEVMFLLVFNFANFAIGQISEHLIIEHYAPPGLNLAKFTYDILYS